MALSQAALRLGIENAVISSAQIPRKPPNAGCERAVPSETLWLCMRVSPVF